MSSFPDSFEYGSAVVLVRHPGFAMLALTRYEAPLAQSWARWGLSRIESPEATGLAAQREVRSPVINNSSRHQWVANTGQRELSEVQKLIAADLGDSLDFLAPVYRLPGTHGIQGLMSVAPYTLIITPVEGRRDTAAQELRDLGLPIRQDSRYPGLRAMGFWPYLVDSTIDASAIDLRVELLQKHGDLVREVRLKLVPMLKPASYQPNDSADSNAFYQYSWHLPKVDAEKAWDLEKGKPSVVVSAVDDGYNLKHADLAPNVSDPGVDIGAPGVDASANAPGEDHGTEVVGVAVARMDNKVGVVGLAGMCGLYPIKYDASAVELAEGIHRAADYTANDATRPVKVLNLSMGFHIGDDLPVLDVPMVDAALAYAFEKGLVLCAGTGNTLGNTGQGQVLYPARHHLVMACGATDQADRRCSFSCFGTDDVHLGVRTGVSVVAPGTGLWTTLRVGGYCPRAGTSFSTPMVSALAALLASRYQLSNHRIREVIERTAEKVPGYQYAEDPDFPHGARHPEVGYGRINAHRALDFADVFIRDWPGDLGEEPSTPPEGAYWVAPDVVVRPADDGTFDPLDPSASDLLSGSDSWIYVRISNRGPADARNVRVQVRVVAGVNLEFHYPQDWTSTDSAHVVPLPLVDQFAGLPAGATVIAKFKVGASQLAAALGSAGPTPTWSLLAEVTADNDYAWASASAPGTDLTGRRNNLAQRSCAVVDAAPGAGVLLAALLKSERWRPGFDYRLIAALDRLPPTWPVWFHPEPGQSMIPGASTHGVDRVRVGLGCVEMDRRARRTVRFAWPLDEVLVQRLPSLRSEVHLVTEVPLDVPRGLYPIDLTLERDGVVVGGSRILMRVQTA